MSKFVDKLEQLSQPATEPMGFRVGGPKQQGARMLLVGSLSPSDTANLAERMAGADAGLLNIADSASGAKALQKVRKALPDIPWGVRFTEGNGKGVKPLTEAGCDFIVFPPAKTALELLESEDMGAVPEVDSSLSDGMLRAISGLPADAVFLSSEEESDYILDWDHLMLFHRVAYLTAKPLLVWAPLSFTANELQALLDAGVKSVIVETGSGEAAGNLKEIRGKIGRLNSHSPRKKRKLTASVPHMVEEAKPPPVEEEEEGEDE